MKRPLLVLLAATLFSGCQSAPPMENPFFGRTTVPPPGTSVPQAYPPPPNYYEGSQYAPPAATPGPGAPPATYPSSPPPPSHYSNPQSAIPRWQSQQAQSAPPVARSVAAQSSAPTWSQPRTGTSTYPYRPGAPTMVARPSNSVGLEEFDVASPPARDASDSQGSYGEVQRAHWVSAIRESDGTLPRSASTAREAGRHGRAPHGAPIRIVEPDDADARPMVRSASYQAPRSHSAMPPGFTDISDLPEPRRGERRAEGFTPTGPAPERPTSIYAVARNPRSDERPASARSRYGYDPQYRWLRGRLEFSSIDRQWRLRYIPLDGETDEFGGSVLLEDSPALDHFRPGDYVTVHGELDDGVAEDGTLYDPLYYVDHAAPL